ncbi:nuclear transport factor 2 family protein [Ohtaekwangia sp.]|uniref:nuclear transport factor 2 family protein n=1 Tax=Ohtaekwangia sp. TaxID=2066019 RepID=UPI002F91D08D
MKTVGLEKDKGYNNRQQCISFLKALEARNIESMLDHCTYDALIQVIPLGKSFSGLAHSFGKFFWTAFLESFSDLRIIFHDMNWMEEESEKVTILITLQAVHTFPFVGIRCSGNTLDCWHIFIFQLNDLSQITNIEVNWNHSEMKAQLMREE